MKNLSDIDFKIDVGYEMLHDAEWHYSQTGYLYKFLMSPKGIMRDHGIDHFEDYRGSKLNRQTGAASPFLKKFYNCLLYTSPSPRDKRQSRMPSSA